MNIGSSVFSNYSPAEADWGIEEFLPHKKFTSVTGSDFSHTLRLREHHISDSALHHDFDTSAHLNDGSMVHASTENFHKYITKYLSLTSHRSLVLDKFKYNLVISNLLDESLVLSKNEQALANLLQLRAASRHLDPIEIWQRHPHDGILLQISLKLYKLVSSRVFGRSSLLFNTLSLIIFLLKQDINMRSQFPYESRMRLFRILLIVSTKIISYRRIWSTIEASKSINKLEEFMIANCKINKAIITSILSIKELDMLTFLNRTESPNKVLTDYAEKLKSHLNTILDSLILNARFSIKELLPLSNGDILEKYAEINNIPLGEISEFTDQTETLSLNSLTAKLSRFNSLRRFFVCQLLTIHDLHSHNFFILKLCDCFNVNLNNFPAFISSSRKLQILSSIFDDHTAALNHLCIYNTQFKSLHSFDQALDYVNDNVLITKSQQPKDRFSEEFSFNESDLAIDQITDKLQNLTTSLKYFKKYKNSIDADKNAEVHEEKLSIFDSFGKELNGLVNMYQSCLSDLNLDYNVNFLGASNPSLCSTSNRNSSNIDQFNPKTFRTSARSFKKTSSFPAPNNELDLANGADRKLKRLLVGLQLGLLTVLEEPSKHGGKVKPSGEETLSRMQLPIGLDNFNAKAFDALTRKQDTKYSNRYSMYSLNSNVSGISDLIASSNITTEAESPDLSKGDDSSHMSKAQLKKKLEESYSRLLNFGNACEIEKEVDQLVFSPEEDKHTEAFTPTVTQDAAFMSDLERTLNLKTDSDYLPMTS